MNDAELRDLFEEAQVGIEQGAVYATIRRCRKKGKWFVKEADPSDHDYYDSGEKGWWQSMTDEEYEYYSEALDEGRLY